MTLIGAGLSHRTSPIEERERFALSTLELPAAMAHFGAAFGHTVILSTCNRTEIYVHPSERETEPLELLLELAAFKRIELDPLPRFCGLRGREVPEHLFRVAAGIDSMVLGESEVLGQVRSAMSAAHEAKTLDHTLSRLVHDALRAGRRARSETHIGRYAVSVSSAAVSLVRTHVPDWRNSRALVVGAGAAGKLAARALRDQGVDRIAVTSRTQERAADVAAYLGGRVVPFRELETALANADVVITSSSAEDYLITPELVARSRGAVETPVVFMDVAVPRDVDPVIAELPGVSLFDIDDLQAVSDTNLERREAAAAEALRIVGEAADEFEEWVEGRRAVPTIKAVVRYADQIRRTELERTIRDLGLSSGDAQKLDKMTAAIVKKLLHSPIDYLKTNEAEEGAEVVRRILGVEDD